MLKCGLGLNCETEIDDCEPNPCMNGGDCIDLVIGYRCVCQLPFSGPNCSTQLTPCQHHRCRNGAQCLPDERYTDYTCRCPPGFTGQFLPDLTCNDENFDANDDDHNSNGNSWKARRRFYLCKT